MDKQEIAEVFEEIALLLEMKGENPFRVRAYRKGAHVLLNTEKSLHSLVESHTLTDLEGIGEDLAAKIETLFRKGRLPFYEKLRKSIPKGLLELSQIHGLGAKKVQILYRKLHIDSIKTLKKACEEGRVAKLKGFGTKTEQNLLDAIEAKETYSKRRLWWDAQEIAQPILQELKKVKGVSQVALAGSMRRKLETIGDLDFVVASSSPRSVMEWFTSRPFVHKVLAKGETRASIRLKEGLQADLRVVSEEEFAFALIYFTGSKEHNLKLRERALKKGWSLSEYGFSPSRKNGKPPKLPKRPTEEEVYRSLGLSMIPPELREDQGEFAFAEKGDFPRLVEVQDIRGTFHNHTTASDGRSSLKEMILAAQTRGWEYIGISDHSKSSVQANGLCIERIEAQMEEIRRFRSSKIHVVAGVECDILPDGTLDFPDTVLKQLDFVIVSIHSALSKSEREMTKRLIRAIEHPLSTIVGHLTGRLLLRREGYQVNVSKVIDACIANHKIIEINGNPNRLDMDWRFWHEAKKRGLRCCINTDAHHAEDHAFIESGINVARKGWLEKKDVINALSLAEVKKLLANIRGK